MSQPIRKNIQEIHKDLIKEEPIYTLLVDGGGLLFHCMKDDMVSCNSGEHIGGIYQFLLQLRMQLSKKAFDYVYVFFDNEYSGWLRWNIYNEYKANRDKKYYEYGLSDYMKEYNTTLKNMQDYIFNKNKNKPKKEKSDWENFIDNNFQRERDKLCEIFNELFIRWQIDDVTEGDDLIAYYCLHKKQNEKVVIMTGDLDLFQLLSDDICIYSLDDKKYFTKASFKEKYKYPSDNILVKKIFTGDSSDNIGNISLLSEEGFFKIIPEAKEKPVSINDVRERVLQLMEDRTKNKKKPLKLHENIIRGVSNKHYNGDFYEINEKIINLKKPLLSDEAKNEIDNTMYAPQDIEGRSFENLFTLINDIGITKLMGETNFASFFVPFKTYVEKEKKYYNEWAEN